MPTGTKHEVTKESMETVQRLAKLGLNQELIAKYMGICKQTLSRHYKDIMAIVRVDNMATVAQVAFEMASSGKMPAMTMFYLKTQAGWRETDKVETTNDEPISRIEITTVNGTIKED